MGLYSMIMNCTVFICKAFVTFNIYTSVQRLVHNDPLVPQELIKQFLFDVHDATSFEQMVKVRYRMKLLPEA